MVLHFHGTGLAYGATLSQYWPSVWCYAFTVLSYRVCRSDPAFLAELYTVAIQAGTALDPRP
eukprot:238609-Rhodomonas_salina.1